MKISPLQKVEPKFWNELTKPMHLAYAGLTKGPALVDDLISNLYDLNFGDDNLVSMVEKFGTHYVDNPLYEWKLKGSSERNIPLVKATYMKAGTETDITASTTDQIGLNGAPIFLYFPENYFSAPAVLGGDHPEDYTVRIMSDYTRAGSYFKYTTQVYGAATPFIPAEELLPGSKWSNLFASVERDFSKRGSGMNFATFFTLQNTYSSIRKSYAVPGSMIQQGDNVPLAVKFQDDNGKTFTKWIDYQGWEFYKQCRRDKAKLLLYGKSTIDPISGQAVTMGESGNPVTAGFGLYEQMQGSNLGFYNNFSVDAFSDFLMQLSYNKLPEDKRVFLVTTGEYGRYQFRKAMAQKMSQTPWLRTDANLKGKTFVDIQIEEYTDLNGITIKLMVDPMLDSPVTVGKIQHPNGGWVSSYIYNIWDIGTADGKPNIQKVAIQGDEEHFIYIEGLRSPFSPGGKGMNPRPASNAVDGYELHKMMNASIMIRNPLRTGRYLPNLHRASY